MTAIGAAKYTLYFLIAAGFETNMQIPTAIKRATRPGTEPIKITVTPNSIDNAIATGAGRYLFGFTKDKRGNGKSIINRATVENDEPVGVKLTVFAKSKGRNIPKKESKVKRATNTELP